MNSAALTFDRLAYVDRLIGGGVEEGQARVHAAALETALRDSVATTSSVENLGIDLRRDIRDVEIKLRDEIRDVEVKLRDEIRDVEVRLRDEIRDVEIKLRDEIRSVEVKLQGVEVKLEAKIEAAVAGAKVDILRWLVVTQAALGGFIFAALKFVH